MKPFTWSYSALNLFETCPRQYGELRVLKRWPDEKGEAAKWGDTVHKAFESRLKFGTPLPEWGKQWEPLAEKLYGIPQLTVEHKIALNARFQPTEYFAPDVWCRAIADVAIVGPKAMVTIDWKTGRFKPDTEQLRLSAAMQLSHFQHVEQATIQYQWLKDRKTTTETIKREHIVTIWRDFLPRVERMERAYMERKFDPKPSGLCNAFCGVLSCEFNGRKKP